MSLKGLTINFIVFLVTAMLCFVFVEGLQRVRYWHRYDDTYWLRYGFAKLDKETEKKVIAYMDNEYKKKYGQERIHVPVETKEGYFKLRPGDYPIKKHREAKYHINSHGLRGKEFDIGKEKGVYRIIFLGGSSTFGLFNEDDRTFPAFFDCLVNNENAPRRFEVINAGIGGYTLFNIRNLLEKELVGLKPDLIIVNSVFNNWTVPYYGTTPRQGILVSLSKKSLFIRTFVEKIEIMQHGRVDGFHMDLKEMARKIRTDEKLWRNYESDLRRVCDFCITHGIKLVLVKEGLNLRDNPDKEWDSLEIWQDVRDRAYSVINEVAVEYDIPVADYSNLAGTPESHIFFTDVAHLTDEGNKKAAQIIYEKIMKENIINGQ